MSLADAQAAEQLEREPRVVAAVTVAAVRGRCSRPYAPSAGRKLRCPSSPVTTGQFTALTVTPRSAPAAAAVAATAVVADQVVVAAAAVAADAIAGNPAS